MKVVVLKQTICPQCDALKMFLHAATKNKYESVMIPILREDSPEEFNRYAESLGIQITPSLIAISEDGDIKEVVQGFSPLKTKQLFEKYFPEM